MHMNQTKMSKLVHNSSIVPVLRDECLVYLQAAELVVGDCVVLSASNVTLIGTDVPSDLVLIQGECVMDESSLTGETIPVVKTALDTAGSFDVDTVRAVCKKNILFAGSNFQKLVEKRNWKTTISANLSGDGDDEEKMIIAIVVATGFGTNKGKLFRSVLHPPKIVMKLQQDAYKFLAVLGCVAFFAFVKRVSDLYT